MHAIQIGEVILFAGNYVPEYFIPCNGQQFKRTEHPKLSRLLGYDYGGDEEMCGTPNLPKVDGHAQWLMTAKSMYDYVESAYPTGSIILGLKSLKPKGFKSCNGQLLPLNNFTNQVLFANIGTTFGGDGRKDFALPNYQHNDPHLGYFIAVDQEMPEEQQDDIVGRIWTYPYDARELHSGETLLPSDGRLLAINDEPELFSVIDTQYGVTEQSFAIPKVSFPLDHSYSFIVKNGLTLMRN